LHSSVCAFQERPIDTVVEGFVHLQQFHMNEIARGFAGTGTYRIREGYPTCDIIVPMDQLLLKPEEIVATLQKPSAEVKTYAFAVFVDLFIYRFVLSAT